MVWYGIIISARVTMSRSFKSIWQARRIAQQQSHAIGLRMRNDLQAIADRHHARLKLVETPPGPPVIASVVAEVYGQPDHRYEDLLLAADTVRARFAIEPGVVDVDHVREMAQQKLTFITDKEKAALNGITTEQIAGTLQSLLDSGTVGLMRNETERNPLRIELRLPVDRRTSAADLAKVYVKGITGQLVPLAELGRWETARVDQMIYHKNLQRVAYVFAETAGRPPADVVVDILADEATTAARGERNRADWQRLDDRRHAPSRQREDLLFQRQPHRLGRAGRLHRRFRRRRGVEDHARRIP